MKWMGRRFLLLFARPITISHHQMETLSLLGSDNRDTQKGNNFDRSTKTQRGRKLQLNSNGGNIALNSKCDWLERGKKS
jgi:hypothetical protein